MIYTIPPVPVRAGVRSWTAWRALSAFLPVPVRAGVRYLAALRPIADGGLLCAVAVGKSPTDVVMDRLGDRALAVVAASLHEILTTRVLLGLLVAGARSHLPHMTGSAST